MQAMLPEGFPSHQFIIQTLPSTSASAKYHSFCSYIQVQEWIGTETHLLQTDWSWTLPKKPTHVVENVFVLLHCIKCTCKQTGDA